MTASTGHAETVQDTQLWAPVTLEVPFNATWQGSLEVQPRFINTGQELATVRVRPSITYSITPKLKATLGYFWAPDFLDGQAEHRLWQQVVYKVRPKQAHWKLDHQVRLEERLISGQDPMAFRARYLVRWQYPIKKDRWYAVLSNEILLNLNDTPATPGGLGQNRVFAGVRRVLRNKAFTELGYMLQWVNSPAPSANQLNHVLVLRVSLPLGKHPTRHPEQHEIHHHHEEVETNNAL